MSRALVVGLGRMGRIHRSALHDLGYEVDAVDPLVDEAEFRFVHEARMRNRYALAAIACPIPCLVDQAYACAGLPMLVEKPFAPTVAEGEMLAAYLATFDQPVAVGFTERFNPRLRQLRDQLGEYSVITEATFTRYSDRPSRNVPLDLLVHDVDLALHLGLRRSQILGEEERGPVVAFDTRADQPVRVRHVEITARIEASVVPTYFLADLMDHARHPVTTLWHHFLAGKQYPRPEDAIRALDVTLELAGRLEGVAA